METGQNQSRSRGWKRKRSESSDGHSLERPRKRMKYSHRAVKASNHTENSVNTTQEEAVSNKPKRKRSETDEKDDQENNQKTQEHNDKSNKQGLEKPKKRMRNVEPGVSMSDSSKRSLDTTQNQPLSKGSKRRRSKSSNESSDENSGQSGNHNLERAKKQRRHSDSKDFDKTLLLGTRYNEVKAISPTSHHRQNHEQGIAAKRPDKPSPSRSESTDEPETRKSGNTKAEQREGSRDGGSPAGVSKPNEVPEEGSNEEDHVEETFVEEPPNEHDFLMAHTIAEITKLTEENPRPDRTIQNKLLVSCDKVIIGIPGLRHHQGQAPEEDCWRFSRYLEPHQVDVLRNMRELRFTLLSLWRFGPRVGTVPQICKAMIDRERGDWIYEIEIEIMVV